MCLKFLFRADDCMPMIMKRITPKFIFCDTQVIEAVQRLVDDIGFESKIFIVNGQVNGYDRIESLLLETGKENTFS